MVRKDLNLEELEWSDTDEFELNEEAVVRSTVETLERAEVDALDVEATKVIPVADIEVKVKEQKDADEVQEFLNIIETQFAEENKGIDATKDISEVKAEMPDMDDTKVISRITDVEEITLTEEEAEELGDLTYHDEDFVKPIKKESYPKKHPGQVRTKAIEKGIDVKSTVKTARGKNIKVQKKKKSVLGAFFENLSWMDAVIGLTGVLAAAILVFVLVFWSDNNNKVKDLGEFTSIGMQLSELDTIGQNGINRIVATGGEDVVVEAVVPSEEEEEAITVMVSVSFVSIERDLKIKFTDKTTGKLLEGVAFELKVVTPSNETLTWIDEDKDGMIYKEGLKGGVYMITIQSVGEFKFPSDATKVMVKDKISYQVINVLDEIKTEDEINVAVEDTQNTGNIEQEELLKDTIEWVPSEKEVSDGADGYVLVEKTTITDPMTLVEASIGGFRKVATIAEGAVTLEVGATKTIQLGGSEEPDKYSKYEYVWSASGGITVAGNGRSATITAGNAVGNGTVTCTVTKTVIPVDTPSETPSTPAPSETPSTPTPSETPSTPAPSETPSTPAPSETSSTPAPSETPSTPAPSETPSTPAPSETPSTPTPSETPSTPAPSETPSTPTPSETPAASDTSTASEDASLTRTVTRTATKAVTETDTHTFAVTITAAQPTVYVTGIVLDKTSLDIQEGNTAGVALKATVSGEGAGYNTGVTWTSSDSSVATVKDGVVTLAAGATAGKTATITATTVGTGKDGKTISAACAVKVVAATTLSLKVNADKADVLVGETYTIVPTVENFVTDKSVKYTVDKTEIATVDANGVVTGVAKGTAVITITTVEKGKDNNPVTATVTVTVKANPKKDTTTLLKDATGNQVYIKDASGKYVQAKWADYYTSTEFYIQSEPVYKYYGWQTLNGSTYYFDENGEKVTGEQVISGVKYNFASDGSLSMNGGVLGIDVSKWNGTIDWNAVKSSGISFVIIRCGYRGSSTGVLVQDPKFESYIKGASKAGLKVGLYFFSQAINEKEAVEEASMAIALAKDYKISYPIFIDTEWTSGGRANSLDKSTRTAVCKAFCETIKSAGYTPGVYACKSWYQDSLNVSSLNGYKIWLAQYASQPTYSSRYDMWQYSDKGKVNGISTNVDMNISYLGY